MGFLYNTIQFSFFLGLLSRDKSAPSPNLGPQGPGGTLRSRVGASPARGAGGEWTRVLEGALPAIRSPQFPDNESSPGQALRAEGTTDLGPAREVINAAASPSTASYLARDLAVLLADN